MKFAYNAVDKAGKPVEDSIEAGTTDEASEKLRQQGLYVTNIAEDRGTVSNARGKRPGMGVVKHLAQWSRQLSVLVKSGTPLAQALIATEQQTSEGPWRTMLERLRAHVEAGMPLSEAMGLRPEIFDEVNRSLVAAGESSGQLGAMLDRLSNLIRQQLKVRRTLVGAMVYPALLLFVGFVVVNVMLLGVLPRFSGLFETLNAPLPPTTMFLMGVSDILRNWWWAILIGVIGGALGMKLYLSGSSGQRVFDGWVVRLPVVGKVVRSVATAKIARLLGVMLESKVPLLESLKLTQHSTGNVHYSDLMKEAVDSASRGEAVSSVFVQSVLIVPSVSEAMRHGEANGQIGPILMDMADFLDEENDVVVKTAMSMLEPLILIGLGVVVGFIALSLFIPLFDLTAMAGQ
ncbi:MAG: type II secretion system F family protein [Planctomycetes bacterium]|nr:type II secretion system F family protein [Planctomycetota bacterium]